MKTDYKDFDNEILRVIKSGESRNMSIHFASNLLNASHFRVLDRRLQVLRKAGKIAFSPKTGWSLITEQTK